MLPGLRASMWRVLADPAPGGHGVGISEITFYRALVELLHSEFRRTFRGFLFHSAKGRVVTEATTTFSFKAGENLEKKNRHFFKMPWFDGWTCTLVFGKSSCHCSCGLFSQVGCSRPRWSVLTQEHFRCPKCHSPVVFGHESE